MQFPTDIFLLFTKNNGPICSVIKICNEHVFDMGTEYSFYLILFSTPILNFALGIYTESLYLIGQ